MVPKPSENAAAQFTAAPCSPPCLLGFGVKNLRCLTDTKIVPLKPLTLLVGRNSSGKSTFLRAFPLLRQSVESARRSPILWSQKDGVDFGSIETAANERAGAKEVTFTFEAKLAGALFVDEPRCELSMTLAPSERGVLVKSYDLRLDQTSIHIEIESDPSRRVLHIEIDGREALRGACWIEGVAYLIPSIDSVAEARLVYASSVEQAPYPDRSASGRDTALAEPIREALIARYAISRDDAVGVSLALPVGPRGAMAEKLAEALQHRAAPAEALDPSSEGDRRLLDLVFLARLPDVLSAMDRVVADYAHRVAYLGPRRAVGRRVYQRSEAAVEDVHPHGDNLADFLVSLSRDELADLSEFTRKSLGFEVAVRTQGLFIEILIKPPESTLAHNIADVGFGYAEVLPLCVTIWLNLFETGRSYTSLLVLEQPELHLHPAHQARLARMLVGALRDSREAGYGASLMIETHSEALVNQMGMLVRKKQIHHEDVQILVFDQDQATQETRIQIAGYKESGALNNWPFGFLAPVAERLEDLATTGE
jgi:predicted ATPase